MPRLFQYQEDLHKAGARKFLFLTVPPLDLTPGGTTFGSQFLIPKGEGGDPILIS